VRRGLGVRVRGLAVSIGLAVGRRLLAIRRRLLAVGRRLLAIRRRLCIRIGSLAIWLAVGRRLLAVRSSLVVRTRSNSGAGSCHHHDGGCGLDATNEQPGKDADKKGEKNVRGRAGTPCSDVSSDEDHVDVPHHDGNNEACDAATAQRCCAALGVQTAEDDRAIAFRVGVSAIDSIRCAWYRRKSVKAVAGATAGARRV
jgi:hypothetical protein